MGQVRGASGLSDVFDTELISTLSFSLPFVTVNSLLRVVEWSVNCFSGCIFEKIPDILPGKQYLSLTHVQKLIHFVFDPDNQRFSCGTFVGYGLVRLCQENLRYYLTWKSKRSLGPLVSASHLVLENNEQRAGLR